MELNEKGICFSEREFTILCNMVFIQDLICFERKEESFSDEEVLQDILSLVDRGILDRKENILSLNPEMKLILDVIAHRKYTLQILVKENVLPNCCIYLKAGGSFVIAEAGTREGEYVILKYMPERTLISYLENGLYFPKAKIPPDIYEIRRKIEPGEIEPPSVERDEDERLRFAIHSYIGPEDLKSETIYVLWHEGSEILEVISQAGRQAEYYSEMVLKNRLEQYAQ